MQLKGCLGIFVRAHKAEKNGVFKGQMPGKCIPETQFVFAKLGLPGHADAMPSLMGAMSDAVKHTQVYGKYHENSFGKDPAEFVIGLGIHSRPGSWGLLMPQGFSLSPFSVRVPVTCSFQCKV